MALLQQDLVSGSGVQLLAYDTDTNLQCVNFTVTAGRSYQETIDGLGHLTTTLGFQYADGT